MSKTYQDTEGFLPKLSHWDEFMTFLEGKDQETQAFSSPAYVSLPVRRFSPEGDSVLVRSLGRFARVVESGVPSHVRLASGVYVSSPEQTFAELATVLDVGNLIIAGSELCSAYGRGEGQLIERSPLTTPEEIMRHLDLCRDVPGVKQARRCARHLFANAASPAEFSLAIFLSLPYVLGGYGCPKPVLNHAFPLGKLGGKLTHKHTLIADLYWPDARLDVEYNSLAHHSQPKELANDAERLNVLGHLGVKVMDVTKEQFATVERMDSVALTVCKHLGKRYRPRSKRHEIEKRYLHTKLQHYLRTGRFDQAGLYLE